jgi:hypothetical protein
MISEDLLSILGCPLSDTRPPFRQVGEWLVCDDCQMAFPIVNGIPHLLVEDARPLAEAFPEGEVKA